jgi:hypothetical protein
VRLFKASQFPARRKVGVQKHMEELGGEKKVIEILLFEKIENCLPNIDRNSSQIFFHRFLFFCVLFFFFRLEISTTREREKGEEN